MARKKKSEGVVVETGDVPFGQITWVLNNLTTKELEQYDENPPEASELVSFMQRSLETGWKVSIKWDSKSECIQVSFVQGRFEYPNAGFAFSARSDDWLDALGLCWFKYTVVANGVLGEFGVSRTSVRG